MIKVGFGYLRFGTIYIVIRRKRGTGGEHGEVSRERGERETR